jgi:hypothetical protein
MCGKLFSIARKKLTSELKTLRRAAPESHAARAAESRAASAAALERTFPLRSRVKPIR